MIAFIINLQKDVLYTETCYSSSHVLECQWVVLFLSDHEHWSCLPVTLHDQYVMIWYFYFVKFSYKVLYLFCRAKRTKSKTSWLVLMPTLWKTAPRRTCTRQWQRHWMKPGENSTWNSNTAQCCWTWASDSTRVLKMWVAFVHQHYVVRIVWGDYPNYELKNI